MIDIELIVALEEMIRNNKKLQDSKYEACIEIENGRLNVKEPVVEFDKYDKGYSDGYKDGFNDGELIR